MMVGVKYVGEIEVVCLDQLWRPGEVKDLPEGLAEALVETNPNFVIFGKNTAGEEGETG